MFLGTLTLFCCLALNVGGFTLRKVSLHNFLYLFLSINRFLCLLQFIGYINYKIW